METTVPYFTVHLIFLIKITFVSICSKEKTFDPRWCSSHLFAYYIKRNILTTFNNQFIMHMTNYETVRESSHSVSKNISAYSLHDVLDKFWTVTFNTSPLIIVDALVCYRIRTELIHTHSRFYIAELFAGW